MTRPPAEGVRLRIVYLGDPLPGWRGGPGAFGVQDKSNALFPGAGADGSVVFDLAVELKPGDGPAPVFVGPLAHGPAAKRFLYLSWRNPTGEYARRLKLPLGPITWTDIAAASAANQPLTAELVDQPKLTSTGVHIGGTRAVVWRRP
jgi:Family of unknown function (DUF5990)